jgi:hypothetical protein
VGADTILLTIFLLGVSFQMHNFWKVTDTQMKQIDMINFTKNIAPRGGTLDVPAAAASVADESRDRLAHSMCGRHVGRIADSSLTHLSSRNGDAAYQAQRKRSKNA